MVLVVVVLVLLVVVIVAAVPADVDVVTFPELEVASLLEVIVTMVVGGILAEAVVVNELEGES